MAEARVNVTWKGQNGDLPQLVFSESSDEAIRMYVAEAIQTGSIPGIARDKHANLYGFVVDRFPALKNQPYPRIFVRPRTPFGA
jgi:hypothetical protein